MRHNQTTLKASFKTLNTSQCSQLNSTKKLFDLLIQQLNRKQLLKLNPRFEKEVITSRDRIK